MNININIFETVPGKKKYQQFLDHCALRRQYFFMLKKCGVDTCDICRPIRGMNYSATALHFLPGEFSKVPNFNLFNHNQNNIIALYFSCSY